MANMKLLVVLLCMVSVSVADDQWCKKEHLHPFESALEYLGETEKISPSGLQTLINELFYRVSCDKMNLGNFTCETCMTSENILEGLGLPSNTELDKETFEKASSYIIFWSFNLELFCPYADSYIWEYIDYEYITERFQHSFETPMTRDDDPHDHGFTLEQLDRLLQYTNRTYRAGSDAKVDPPADICLSSNVSNFRSGDIYEESALEDPIDGVTDDEIGAMNSLLLHRLVRGDCIMPDMRVEGYPHPEDYVFDLFNKFAGDDCLMDDHDFEELLEHLGIGHDDHDHGHDHDHFVEQSQTKRSKRNIAPNVAFQLQGMDDDQIETLDDHDHDHDHDHGGLVKASERCLEGNVLLASHGLNVTEVPLTRDDFLLISPALVQQVAQGCQHPHDDVDPERPSSAEVWLYGILSITLISAIAPLGIFVVKFRNTNSYKYIMTVMLGLAVGALAGDALLHLIPHSLGVHDHDDHGHDHDHDHDEDLEFVWKMFLACCGIWGFFNLQAFLQKIGRGHSHNVDVHEITVHNPTYGEKQDEKQEPNEKSNGDISIGGDSMVPVISDDGTPKTEESVGLMVAVGDSFHNFADGLAVGASFAYDLQLGLATTVAILCHEVPHEFGDVAAMVSTGWSVKRVLCLQLLSQSTAYIGLFIGIPVGQVDGANEWIYALAAGLFLYVALVDITPELMEYVKAFRNGWIILAANAGIFLGFLAMLLIAIYEHDIYFA